MTHPLQDVFDQCVAQATEGKGNERHGNGKPFLEQPWVDIADTYGTGFLYGQAAKKLREAMQMTGEARERELYGAINYVAMGLLHEEMRHEST